MKPTTICAAIAVLAATTVPPGAAAQSPSTGSGQAFPVKPVRILIGQSPGGASDLFARLIAQKLNETWKQPVVVESRPGAAGSIAAELTWKSPPDGHTMLLSTAGQIVLNPHLTKLAYDPLKDLSPLAYVTGQPLLLVAHPSVPAKSVKELVALAKARAGRLNHGSGGTGSPAHLAMELFKSKTGTKMTHVPFKGVGPSITALIAGEIDVSFASPSATLAFIRSQRLRALAISTPHRSATLPDMPTVAEAGVPGYQVTSWYGLFGPGGMPGDIVDRIHDDVARVIALPDARARIAAEGGEPANMTVAQFAAFIRAESAQWAKVIRAAGIKGD